jgi:hypothetical protein
MGRYDFISAAFYNEVKNEVEEKLRKQQLTKPLTQKEMAAFCEAMVRNLELKRGALSEVRRWAQAWQSEWLRSSRG